MSILLIGGVFDRNKGRSSGYIQKLGDLLGAVTMNGGNYIDLVELSNNTLEYNCILWFCDVSNEEAKLLPSLISNNRKALIIRSKFNSGKYTDEQLLDMMREQQVEYLVEFTKESSKVKSRVLGIGGGMRDCRESLYTLANYLDREIYYYSLRAKPILNYTTPLEPCTIFTHLQPPNPTYYHVHNPNNDSLHQNSLARLNL